MQAVIKSAVRKEGIKMTNPRRSSHPNIVAQNHLSSISEIVASGDVTRVAP